jgi:hypothetical protein
VLEPEVGPVHNSGVFGFGPAEIFVLICLGVIFLGRKKLPDLGELLRSRFHQGAHVTRPREWNRLEWLLISGILILGTLMIALFAARG